MLHKIAEKITLFYISKNKVEQCEKETYDYCFEVLLSTAINLIAIIIMAVVTKLYIETLCFTICFMSLRGASGGFHAKTHIGCFFALLIAYSALPISYLLINLSILRFISIGFISLGSIVVLILAPVDNINNPFAVEMKKKLRLKSVIYTILAIIAYCSLIVFEATIRYAYVISYVILIVALSLGAGVIKNRLQKRRAKCNIVEYIEQNVQTKDI